MSTVRIPEILLPSDGADMKRWAVIACDQFTSDEEYWNAVRRITSGYPSAFDIILPEIYLNDETQARIDKINGTMRGYLEGGIFRRLKDGFVLVERTTQSGTRTGIVLAIDLEDYSFENGAKTPVRSTEETIRERIPPRVKIRENAPLELPHVMLLYDDKENSVLKGVERGDLLYDFELMCGGGRVKGTYVNNSEVVADLFENLKSGCNGLLFAVGDGNHSLAAAKTCWEKIKKELSDSERVNHPARFALAEAVNIYDKALVFEPIYRFIKGVDGKKFADGLITSGKGRAYIVVEGQKSEIPFPANIPEGIRAVDEYISDYIARFGGVVDYIHGESELINLTKSHGGVGILLPSIKKEDFFRLISEGGNLPRKTFSMGEGNEKRYYIEAKLIQREKYGN